MIDVRTYRGRGSLTSDRDPTRASARLTETGFVAGLARRSNYGALAHRLVVNPTALAP